MAPSNLDDALRPTVAQSIGSDLAARVFTLRSRGGQRPAEAHLSERELAGLLALAAQCGARAALEAR